MYQVRKACAADMPDICHIYELAREFMRHSGNPYQWGTEKPSLKQIHTDIENENLYVLVDQHGVHGVFALILGEDPTYTHIDGGAWSRQDHYATIHRIAGDGTGGIFSAALNFCQVRCKYLRIDTHENNAVMLHLLEKHGFTRCGIIHIGDGTPRIAFDK